MLAYPVAMHSHCWKWITSNLHVYHSSGVKPNTIRSERLKAGTDVARLTFIALSTLHYRAHMGHCCWQHVCRFEHERHLHCCATPRTAAARVQAKTSTTALPDAATALDLGGAVSQMLISPYPSVEWLGFVVAWCATRRRGCAKSLRWP